MFNYILWRRENNEWVIIRGLSSNNIPHCVKNEVITLIGNKPEEH